MPTEREIENINKLVKEFIEDDVDYKEQDGFILMSTDNLDHMIAGARYRERHEERIDFCDFLQEVCDDCEPNEKPVIEALINDYKLAYDIDWEYKKG